MTYPIYTEVKDSNTGETVCIQREDAPGKGWSIPIDLANSDYQRHLAWLENPEAAHFTPSV